MDLELTVRHHDVPDRVKTYAKNEIRKLSKFHDRIVSCHIILDSDKEGEAAEITLHIAGKDFVASDTTDDITKSIDNAVDKMEKQIKRYKGKRFGK